MLRIPNSKHLFDTLEFAQKVGRLNELLGLLSRVSGFARDEEIVTILKDFAPHSFGFCVGKPGQDTRFNGGIIYHGPLLDGSRPETFSIQLVETDGWSIHT